jgi:hypothetical protein
MMHSEIICFAFLASDDLSGRDTECDLTVRPKRARKMK